MEVKTKTERAMTLITWALVLGLSVIFVAGLASKSLTPDFLGKSNAVWVITLTAGLSALVILLLTSRSKNAARIIPRVALLGLMTLALFEGTAYLIPNIWPVPVLLRTPQWARASLPESAYERDNFRNLRADQMLDDPDLVVRLAPNLDEQIIWGEISFRKKTDHLGFANNDPSLYQDADILVTGDSFTFGDTVEFDESWPQQLAQSSNLRVLNLGQGGWEVYNYARVLEKYGGDVAPSDIIVTLLFADSSQRMYRLTDGTLPVLVENPRWSTQGLKTGAYVYFGGDVIRSMLPFSTTAAKYFIRPKSGTDPRCEFTLGGKRLSFQFSSLAVMYGPHISTFVDRVREDLDSIRDFAESKGADLHFVYLSSPARIYVPLLSSATDLNDCAKTALRDYQSGKIDFDKHLALYQVLLFLEPHELGAYTLRDPLTEEIAAARAKNSDLLVDGALYLRPFAIKGEQLAWSTDGHPNVLGYKRIAELMATLISD